MGTISSINATHEEKRNAVSQIVNSQFVREIVDDVYNYHVNNSIPFMFKMYHLLLYVNPDIQKYYDETHDIKCIYNSEHYDLYGACGEYVHRRNSPINSAINAFHVIYLSDNNLEKHVDYDNTLKCYNKQNDRSFLRYKNAPKRVDVNINVECYELNKLVKERAIECIDSYNAKIANNKDKLKLIAQQIDEYNIEGIEKQITDAKDKFNANDKIIAESTNPLSLSSIVEENKLLHKIITQLHAKKEKYLELKCKIENLTADNDEMRNGIQKLQTFISKLLLEPFDNKDGIVVSVNPSNETVICPMEMLNAK